MAEQKIPTRDELEKKYAIKQQETQKEPVQKIATGPVTIKKRSLGRRFADIFIGKDINDVGNYILMGVVVPSLKTIICDVARDVPQLLFFGTTRNVPGYGPNQYNPQASYFRYDKVSTSPTTTTNMYGQPKAQTTNYMRDDIILRTAGEAESVLLQMLDRIERYGEVTLLEVNDMLGVPFSHTDNDWGWKNLASARIRPVRGGHLLDLPPITYLK